MSSSAAARGVLLVLGLLSPLALAAGRIPQAPGPAPGAPVALPAATPLSAAPGGLVPQDVVPPPAPALEDSTAATLQPSAFAQWWGPLRGVLPERIRGICAGYAATPEVAGWCARYHGPSATVFDARALLSSDALVLAAYFGERQPLMEALDSLQKALEAVRPPKLIAPGSQDELTSARAVLSTARSRLAVNSGEASALELTGVLPGVELGALLEPVFRGLTDALQARAEAEAVLYVLLEFDERICTREVTDTWGQVRGHIRDWLPSTCTSAHNAAFGVSLGAGGTASLTLLRKTVEEDLRSIPAHLAFEATLQAEGGRYAPLAPAVRELVDAMVGGVHPVRALDTFSRRLEALSSEPTSARLACVSALPAAFTRYGELVDTANQGLLPPMDARARGLAVLLLSLQRDSCGELYAPVAGQSRLQVWASLAPALAQSAEAITQVVADLRRLTAQARRLGEDSDTSRVDAARLLAEEGVSALEAVDVALDGLLRVNAVVGAGQPSAAAQRAAVRTSLLEARRHVATARELLRMVAAAIARDLSTVYQLLLAHQAVSSKTDRYDASEEQRCTQAQAWKAPAAADPASATSEWRCERTPCVCLPSGLVRSGGLLVALADARDAQEVKSVILASASPVGSWRWRSDPDVHHFVSLGGMVGFGGSYYLSGVPDSGRFTPRLLVPFGVDYQLGRAALTWSVFFQVIDLAGYTRFASQEERSSPRVMEAVSPGMWIKGMLPRTPFTLTMGAAYDLDAGGVTPGPAWRLSAGVAIDTPLFVLYRN